MKQHSSIVMVVCCGEGTGRRRGLFEEVRGKSGRRAARACGARRAVALAVVRPNGRTVEPEQVRETQRESLRARLLVSRVAKYLDSLLS